VTACQIWHAVTLFLFYHALGLSPFHPVASAATSGNHISARVCA